LSKEDAFSLNFLTDVAQVSVSILGNMFSITFFPEKSFKEASERSCFTRENPGASALVEGKSPDVFRGFPYKVTFAIEL